MGGRKPPAPFSVLVARVFMTLGEGATILVGEAVSRKAAALDLALDLATAGAGLPLSVKTDDVALNPVHLYLFGAMPPGT
jgi:hypothetical protein